MKILIKIELIILSIDLECYVNKYYRIDFLAAIVVVTSIIGLVIIALNYQGGASKIGHLVLGLSLSVIPYVVYRAIDSISIRNLKRLSDELHYK